MVKSLYEGRLAVDIAGLKMATPVTTGSGTFGFGLEFTDFLDLEKVGAVCVKGTSLLPSAGNKGQRAVETPSGMLKLFGNLAVLLRGMAIYINDYGNIVFAQLRKSML